MWHNNHLSPFNSKFSHCSLLEDITTSSDISPVHHVTNKKENTFMNEKIEDKLFVQSIDIFDKEVSLVLN
jgi:hypothetical protein